MEDGQFQLFDINGRMLLQENLTKGINQIIVNEFAAGVYWAKVIIDDSFVIKKIIIQ